MKAQPSNKKVDSAKSSKQGGVKASKLRKMKYRRLISEYQFKPNGK